MLKTVQRARTLATAVFGVFAAGAALAQAAGASVGVRLLFTAIAFSGALVALGVWLLEREAAWAEESDARLSRALGQLGDFGARVGAIYQLEDLARNVPARYHQTVYAVLNDYVRAEARWQEGDTAEDEDRRPTADVQTALKVLGRRDQSYDRDLVVRLSRADLRGVSLRGGRFDGIRLRRAQLGHAQLEGVSFRGAKLREARLQHADLGPDRELGLPGADLTAAGLPGANLTDAKLKEATLTDADLRGATLTRADLRGANLEGARLARAELRGARYDDATVPPSGFDLKAAGCLHVPRSEAPAHSA